MKFNLSDYVQRDLNFGIVTNKITPCSLRASSIITHMPNNKQIGSFTGLF